ncbi:glycosyltransferase [Flavobacterium daemonense]|uniref:glycosyltransferase n=1 Tax=Flavobacterium daemonense TaxID=1393049 RepID=UPI00118640F3|nr:glycosyltransferase [Flavobacterium daemonense]KAF2333125.1 glycosyltransferase [Flavobacterium daemonense]
MKVLLINTYDKWGAANSCLRLHEGLLKKDVDSCVLLRYKEKNIKSTQIIKQEIKIISKSQKLKSTCKRILKKIKLLRPNTISPKDQFIRNRSKGLEAFNFPDSKIDITTSEWYKQAEIINLHWVADFVDYSSFFEKNEKPIVWTLHDMNPFSGGEHYLEEYLGIDESGFPIKRKLTKEEITIADNNISIKLKALSNVKNLVIVSPSQWLANEASKSVVFKSKPIFCIPYGLNSEIFAPRNKEYSRELLNIPKDKKVILFVADSIDNNRKGFVFLKRAFELLNNENLVLCAIGAKTKELESINNILELGRIFDERLMSAVYSAADVFVIPSLMDNLPNTVLESLMCGTPVIGFPIGGIPDMIQDGFNGFITEEISVNSLLKTIKKFLDDPNYFDRIQIRAKAVEKYDLSVQAEKYIDLYSNILNEKLILNELSQNNNSNSVL